MQLPSIAPSLPQPSGVADALGQSCGPDAVLWQGIARGSVSMPSDPLEDGTLSSYNFLFPAQMLVRAGNKGGGRA